MEQKITRRHRKRSYRSKAYLAYLSRVHWHHFGHEYSSAATSLVAFKAHRDLHMALLNIDLFDLLDLKMQESGFLRYYLATPEQREEMKAMHEERKAEVEKRQAERRAKVEAYRADLLPYRRKIDWNSKGYYHEKLQ